MPTLASAIVSLALVASDHRGSPSPAEAIALLAVPVLWMVGVVLLLAHKLRSR